jgi:hypothetical protein
VKLDGLRIAATAAWPGAIHMGHGEILPIVDERATPEQREALTGYFTVIVREGGALKPVPYAEFYHDRLQKAADHLRQQLLEDPFHPRFPFLAGQVQQTHILLVRTPRLLRHQRIVGPAIGLGRIQIVPVHVAGKGTRLAPASR